mgnify:CR=1 FL=1
MELHAKLVRSQLSFFKPFVAGLSLEVTRKGQDKLGELMTALHRRRCWCGTTTSALFRGRGSCPRISAAAA